MAVTWTSGYSIDEAYPFVEWRMKGEESSKRTPAGTLTFTRGHLCGTFQTSDSEQQQQLIIQCVKKYYPPAKIEERTSVP